jgi:hypothetical protein
MIDTNVILDDILNRGSNAETARKISRLVTDDLVKCYASNAEEIVIQKFEWG